LRKAAVRVTAVPSTLRRALHSFRSTKTISAFWRQNTLVLYFDSSS